MEEHDRLKIDARGMRSDYLQTLNDFRTFYREECAKANIDYVPMDTSISFDRALRMAWITALSSTGKVSPV